jgi:rhodanese-related sulfurtransferase
MSTRPGVPDGAFLLDVRRDDEWAAGHAPDAVHIPLADLPDRAGEVPRDVPVVAVCHSGMRSARATAFLQQQGHSDVTNYEGGMLAWAGAGGPVVSENGQPPSVG